MINLIFNSRSLSWIFNPTEKANNMQHYTLYISNQAVNDLFSWKLFSSKSKIQFNLELHLICSEWKTQSPALMPPFYCDILIFYQLRIVFMIIYSVTERAK